MKTNNKGEWVSKLPFKFIFGNHLIETDQQVICRLMENDYDAIEEAEANARLIVIAVNNFHPLLDALKLAHTLLLKNEDIEFYQSHKEDVAKIKELILQIESENNQQ
jgi:hypothetical protein